MLRTLGETFPEGVSWTEPDGGLFTWLTFPEAFDTDVFMRDHAFPEARVAYVPGASFFPRSAPPNFARMSFATQTDERIVAGISRLGAAIKSAVVTANV